MKIDEGCINNKALELIQERLMDCYPTDSREELAYIVGMVNGITYFAEDLRKVLKEE